MVSGMCFMQKNYIAVIEDNTVNIFRTELDCQILANREFYDKKFTTYDSQTQTYYIAFINANDHPEIIEKFPESSNIVRGINHFIGYILKPLTDGRQGTDYICMIQSDFAGYIPSWVVGYVAHKPHSIYSREIVNKAING